MQKTQLAAAVAAVLGFALHGPAMAADAVDGKLDVKEKSSSSKVAKKDLAKKDKKKGKEGACKGKEGACKGKEGACKGKEGSCKSKEGGDAPAGDAPSGE